MSAKPANPPTTPPAIAPAWLLLFSLPPPLDVNEDDELEVDDPVELPDGFEKGEPVGLLELDPGGKEVLKLGSVEEEVDETEEEDDEMEEVWLGSNG